MDRQEVGCGGYGLDRAGSGQGQVADTCACGFHKMRWISWLPENWL